jgi:CRISPR/Cas system-associated endonuclease/helicase Cas3
MCVESNVLVKRIKNNKMKKQINSISNLSVKGMITITILSAMLCTFDAKANSKPSRASKVVNVEMESKSTGDKPLLSNSAALIEAVESVKYNADEFVQADVALETKSWISRNAEAMNETAKYSAEGSVLTDMVIELRDWNNGDALVEDPTDLVEPPIEIGYHASEFVENDMATEINSWNSNSGF